VVLTGWGSVATAVNAMKKGATHDLQKPVSFDELLIAWSGEDPAATTSPTEDHGLPSLVRQEWEYIHKVLGRVRRNVVASPTPFPPSSSWRPSVT